MLFRSLAADGANCSAGNYPLGVDASGAVQDCTAATGSGTMTTVKADDTQVGGADIVTLDFGLGFDATEAPDTEMNISLDLSEVTSAMGTLPVAGGGTGATSLTDGGILLGSGTGAVTALGVATNGQIPIGDGTTDPVLATITAVADETDVTNGAGTITIGIVNPLIAGKGGSGAATHTDGGVLIGKGTAAFANTGVLADGTIIIGDGVTNPTTLAAFSSSTGTLSSGQFPILAGDVTTSGGSLTTSIAADAVSNDEIAPQAVSTDQLQAVNKPTDGQVFSYDSTTLRGEWIAASGGAPTDADYLVGTTNGSLSAEIVVGTTPGGELGNTWASPTLDDSVTTTGWVMGTFSATQLTSPTVLIDLLDGVGAVDMDYGSVDITDHTFTTDGTGTAEIVLPAGAIDSTEILDDTILEADLKAVDSAVDEECLTFETTTGDFEWQTCGSGSDTNAVKEYWWPASATLPLEVGDSIPPISKVAGTNLDELTVNFDSGTDECRTVNFKVPSDVVSGDVTFRVNWKHNISTGTGNVIWDFRTNSGTATGVSTDTALSTRSFSASAADAVRGKITVATSTDVLTNLGWVANESVDSEFCRDANNASDTMSQDALVVGFSIDIPRA